MTAILSARLPRRLRHAELIDAAARIERSQSDEIAFMQQWLRERGEQAPDPTVHHAMR